MTRSKVKDVHSTDIHGSPHKLAISMGFFLKKNK